MPNRYPGMFIRADEDLLNRLDRWIDSLQAATGRRQLTRAAAVRLLALRQLDADEQDIRND